MKSFFVHGLSALDLIHTVSDIPKSPEKYKSNSSYISIGGNAANASVTISRLGAKVYLSTSIGKDEVGKIIEVIDPYATVYFEIHENSKSTLDLINSYLKIENIFSKKLRNNKKFVNTLNNSLSRQINKGTLESLKEILN